MGPEIIIDAIGVLAKEVYAAVKRVEANQHQCERLYKRIDSVSTILSTLKTIRKDEKFVEQLNALHLCMQQCFSFIKQFQEKKTWIVQVIKSGAHEKEFTELNVALTDKISLLELSINVQQLFNHAEDKEDQRLDLAWLKAHHQEIIDGQASILAAVQDIKVEQKSDLEEIKNRLLSLKLHVQNLNQPATQQQATQYLISPSYQSNTRSLASGSLNFDKAAAKQSYSQGQSLEKSGNHQAAAAAYETAATAGYYRAKTNLGLYYLQGKGGLPINKQKAHQLFLEAANEGHTRAMCNLFTMLWHGDGVPEDKYQAKKWLKNAVEQRDDWAIKKQDELKISFSELTL